MIRISPDRVATNLENLVSQGIKILFKMSGKSQGIYLENGRVREMSGNLKSCTCQT